MEKEGGNLIANAPVHEEYQVEMSMHAHSRNALISKLRLHPDAKKGFVLLQGGKTTEQYDTDREIVFRQESNFQYLFGVDEADCFGGIDVVTGHSVIFIPKLPEAFAVWNGEIHPPSWFKQKYQVDEAHYIEDIPTFVKKLAPSIILTLKVFHVSVQGFDAIDREILKPILDECRVFKSPQEIELMRYVNRISSWAHVEVMKKCKPGMKEYELEALFLYLTYKNGRCRQQSYTCICGAGKGAATLHYPYNDKEIKDGDIVLLDMGAEYHCYCSDITNTFPANGKFTQDQKDIYNIVLAASTAVIEAMKPGVEWTHMHELAEKVICEGLVKLDLIRGSVADLLEHHIPALFFPHGLGHLLGLDTHDVGGFPNGRQRIQRPGIRYLRANRPLEPGMIITVEPGLYFIDANLEPALKDPVLSKFLNAEKLARFRNFGGVRIEDDILILPNGVENLTKLPRTVAEIEATMGHRP